MARAVDVRLRDGYPVCLERSSEPHRCCELTNTVSVYHTIYRVGETGHDKCQVAHVHILRQHKCAGTRWGPTSTAACPARFTPREIRTSLLLPSSRSALRFPDRTRGHRIYALTPSSRSRRARGARLEPTRIAPVTRLGTSRTPWGCSTRPVGHLRALGRSSGSSANCAAVIDDGNCYLAGVEGRLRDAIIPEWQPVQPEAGGSTTYAGIWSLLFAS
ncbi:hypothetical protein OH77DRAFT_1140256 [Trametes cingulata]|nr:hypothetical protein OH77DRAFT_1140256 [Trametes cingulata]